MVGGSTIAEEMGLLRAKFATVTDPRHARGRVHPLAGLLTLTVLGLMAGARSLSDISRWAKLHPEIHGLLGLRRSPSVATLSRLLRKVRVQEVREALFTFAQEICQRRVSQRELTLAADGKTLRGVWENGRQLQILHLFVQEAAIALDQVSVPHHRGEVEAASAWTREVAARLPGLSVLTGDALLADRDLCAAIVTEGQDYLIRLKKTNQDWQPT